MNKTHSNVIKDLKERILKDQNIEILRIDNIFSIGMPDLILMVPNETIFLEIKRTHDKLNVYQKVWWNKALRLKQRCYILMYGYDEIHGEFKYALQKPKGNKVNQWGDYIWSSIDGPKKLRDIFLSPIIHS